MAANIPHYKLNNGKELPLIGFGTFKGHSGDSEVYEATKIALQEGYRFIDTAYIYETENAVGRAVRDSGVPREEAFILSKLWQNFHEPQHVRPVFDRTLKNFGFDYLDCYIIHWPMAWEFGGYEFKEVSIFRGQKDCKRIDVPIIDTWREMEKLVDEGLVKTIGVSNFTIPMLEELLKDARIPPAVNEVEIHPSLPQQELLDYCTNNNIALIAYSPIGNPGYAGKNLKTVEEPKIKEIAEKYNISTYQLLLNYGVSRNYAVIPKSVTPSRIKANIQFVKISDEDIKTITEVGLQHPIRTCSPLRMFGPSNDIFNE
ncbi:unnamed protein product [Cunninghamella blakesleeana]